ncbi:MAG: hypothetical protein IPL58_01725 [Betaproteobacteria bacterium]|jgi:hypothetical protein|uniref:Uncharacterized protein n=1 Tax=Candidatus Proximibacter danicus TaxID=2954365 RepID=A0A9D7JZC8_9PROT|nr:hypothetical protein [Candidatus Proximibacter danicus]MBK9445601.1 hypothetical protein [Betaproteobacteria bacterium]
MIQPELNAVYLVELCSGEQRRWRHCGVDGRGVGWWQDMETGVEFSEASLLYVWQILQREDEPPTGV